MAEGARLESVYTARYPGFESLSLRQFNFMDRRHALKTAMLGMLAGSAAAAPSLPEDSLFRSDPELYWKRLRAEQFFLPEWRVFLKQRQHGSSAQASGCGRGCQAGTRSQSCHRRVSSMGL